MNTVLRSLTFKPDDEILVTDHEYNACRNAVNFVALRSGARVVVAPIKLPVSGPEMIVNAVLAKVTARTRLALIDHITSPTALLFPIETLVTQLRQRGVETLVDGAHAIGMVDLDLGRLGAAYYTGNCHKWLCTPKSAALLHVRGDKQAGIRPLVISHGANSPLNDRSRFQLEFDWTGTIDPTPYLCIPAALRFMRELLPGGWIELRRRNHELAVKGRRLLIESLGFSPICPESMLGAMAAVEFPPGFVAEAELGLAPDAAYEDRLEKLLFEEYRITLPVIRWPEPATRLLRISAQVYNQVDQYQTLVRAIKAISKRTRG